MSEPGFAVGVDLGGTNVRAALVDVLHGGRILAEERAPVSDKRPEAVADLVAELVTRVDGGQQRAGVGVGFAGMLRGWTGVVVNGPNFGWREVDLRSLLRARLGATVELYNDLNAIAYGEAHYGAPAGARDVLCVYVGTGMGAGLVLDGKLYIGATHLAGEIGHVKVVPGGRPCGCGQRGCIEAYVSGRNLAVRAHAELGDGKRASSVVEIAGGFEHVHAGHIDQAARDGDAWAGALWDEVAPLLGLVLANAVTTLNPSHLVMGGGVWEGAAELRRRALVTFHELVNVASTDGLTIQDTTLGDAAGVLGSAALIASGAIRA